MLEDRDYMRQPEYKDSGWRPSFRLRWSWTVFLLVINAIVFVLECALCGYPPRFFDNNLFALSVEGIKHGYVWQFLTFQFMHATLLHILFNSWTIFVFGRLLESQLGPGRFLTLYFSSGVIGGVVQVAGGWFWPFHFGTAVVGASAGAMGLMAAFAMLYPEEPLTFFLYFFPITTRAKFFVWGFAWLSILCILFPHSLFTMLFGGNVSNAAHLGGMAMGFVYIRWLLHGNWARLGGALQSFKKSEPASPPRKRVESSPAADFLESDVDQILDKISAHGIQSLTTREREILENARQKMRRP